MNFRKVNDKDHIAMSSETAPDEKLSNLPAHDMIARAVQLADSIEDYDLYCRYVRQEFGLNDSGLKHVVDEAMKVIAERALNGDTPGKAGTNNNPSNEPGERLIDVKAGSEWKASKVPAVAKTRELIVGNQVVPVFFAPEPVEKAKLPSLKSLLSSIGFTSYNKSHKATESTQTGFKKMWKKDVQPQYYKTEKDQLAFAQSETDKAVDDNATSETQMYGGGTENEDNSQVGKGVDKNIFSAPYSERKRDGSIYWYVDVKGSNEAGPFQRIQDAQEYIDQQVSKFQTQKAGLGGGKKDMVVCPKCKKTFDASDQEDKLIECPFCGYEDTTKAIQEIDKFMKENTQQALTRADGLIGYQNFAEDVKALIEDGFDAQEAKALVYELWND